ncbi:hypothetical protein KBB68_03835 [Candidatus Babeliales bacterium]|nr:hypothetical protein [Candidatus Babeliales bacterium]
MKKWSKIIQFSLLLVSVACSDNLFSTEFIKNQQIIQKQDPQVWFNKMKQKYPQVGLEKVEFIVGSHWSMGYDTDDNVAIFCPSDIYYGYKSFTPKDELALLHEAGHARNHHWTKLFYKKSYQKTFAMALVLAFFLGTDGIQKSKNLAADAFKENSSSDFVVKLCKFVSLYGVISALFYKIIPPIVDRFDETLADDFANQHGDVKALKGGFCFL